MLRLEEFNAECQMCYRAIAFFQTWYNFIKPHDSLKLKVPQGKRKWLRRTLAMAEGLTDHIWTIEEVMNFRVPVQ